MSILQGRHGFACDNVVGYEVALADGSVVMATSEEHSELYLALKGGGNNFGIVTRFVMKVYPIPGSIWGGMSLRHASVASVAAEALEDFTRNASSDPDSTIILVACHLPLYGGDSLLALTFNTGGVEKPECFERLWELPELFSEYKNGRMQELLPFAELPLDN